MAAVSNFHRIAHQQVLQFNAGIFWHQEFILSHFLYREVQAKYLVKWVSSFFAKESRSVVNSF